MEVIPIGGLALSVIAGGIWALCAGVVFIYYALIRISKAIENLQVNASATSVGCPSCSSWHNIDYTDKENSDGS